MAAIRIQLPGRNEVSVITLADSRITVGRAPHNVVQILDRTLSKTHAELLKEGDHYRLRDAGSTNGVFVNGRKVTEHDLRESCKLGFGTFECEFLVDSPVEATPPLEKQAAGENGALHGTNSALEAELTTTRAEPDATRKTLVSEPQEKAAVVARAEFEKIQAAHRALQDAHENRKRELQALQANLAAERAEREKLKQAADAERATVATREKELANLRANLEAARADGEKLQQALRDGEGSKEAREKELGGVQADLAVARTDKVKLQQALEAERAANEAREKELAGRAAESARLDAELAATRAERDQLQHTLDAERIASEGRPKDAEFVRLQSENSAARAEIQTQGAEIKRLRVDLATAADAAASAVPRGEHDRLIEEHQRMVAENQRLLTEHERVLAENQRLSAERERERSEQQRLNAEQLTLSADHQRVVAENATLTAARESLESDVARLRGELETLRAHHVELAMQLETRNAELAEAKKAHATLASHAATLVAPDEYERLAGEHRRAREAQQRQEEEIARFIKEVAALASERETLQRTCENQRRDLDAAPKPSDMERLQSANGRLSEQVNVLTRELEGLREAQARSVAQLASSISREEHEKLVAEHAGTRETHARREAELMHLSEQLAELRAQYDRLQRTLKTQESEIERLRILSVTAHPSGAHPGPETAGGALPGDGHLLPTDAAASTKQLEQALSELGFTVRRVK